MFESPNKWSLEIICSIMWSTGYRYQFPAFLSEVVECWSFIVLTHRCPFILPFLHKVMSWQAVYEFSKVEKKFVKPRA